MKLKSVCVYVLDHVHLLYIYHKAYIFFDEMIKWNGLLGAVRTAFVDSFVNNDMF